MLADGSLADIYEITLKIFLSIILCGFIGLEREFRQKGAGLRTHILVGVGSALIVLTSLHVFDMYKDITIVDPTRMITGIVTGIGFLCAGTIIRAGANVKGLTTAATLWIVSGIGIAVGAGAYSAALIVTVAVSFVLIVVREFEKKVGKKIKELL